MFSSRLRCHFCAARSPHPKTVREFQCTACEAFNFFDGKGNVIDTPAVVASHYVQPKASSRRQHPATTRLTGTLEPQQQPFFCRTCVQNQLLYTQALANYLPDDDHPNYRQIEAALPQYKADLEKRYPQICKKCAPLAQASINRADYYSKTRLLSTRASANKAGRDQRSTRQRDDWQKRCMRQILRCIGLLSIAGLSAQTAYHGYGALMSILPQTEHYQEELEIASNPSMQTCSRLALSMRFDSACFEFFGTLIPYTIVLAAGLLWHNPGLKAWYHHTNRIEAIAGQKNHFWMQALILAIRSVAWYALSDPARVATLEPKQLGALHMSVMLFLCLFEIVAHHTVRPVAWKMRGTIMPRPEDKDVLGAFAGPEQEQHIPEASKQDPWRYLRNQDGATFNINRLAPQTSKIQSRSQHPWAEAQFPSPEDTEESDVDDTDAMETDFQPVMRSSFRAQNSPANSQLRARHHQPAPQTSGWSGMRGEIFGMQDQMREEAQKMSQFADTRSGHVSPFRGKLPPAPMSMERRLRNPIVQPAAEPEVPLSQQKNFFAQMSSRVTPITAPTRESGLELRKSAWTLPGDVRETGLEDLMSGSNFRINDEPSVSPAKKPFGWVSSLLGR